jgi:hypothetical protein
MIIKITLITKYWFDKHKEDYESDSDVELVYFFKVITESNINLQTH